MNNLNKLQKKTIIIAVILVITIIGYYVYGRENTKEDIIEDEEILVKKDENLEEVTEEKIIVHITGAVHNEGIVTLKENSRISDQTTPNMIQRISRMFERNPLISKEI